MSRFSVLLLVLVSSAALAPLRAAEATAAPGVRIYTNADLEELPVPRDPPPAEAALDPAESWAFVLAHLEREERRLAAERAAEHERAWLELEEAASLRRELDIVPLAYAPACVHGPRRGVAHEDSKRFPDPRPLHAGPTQAQLHRERAIQNKGSDAFPN